MKPFFFFSIVAATTLLAGCVSAPPDAGFSDVQRTTRDRTGQTLQWRGQSAEDDKVDRAVHDLLQQPLTPDAAVHIALLQNRSLQATYGELGIARADLVQAGLIKNPVLSAQVRFPSVSPSGTDVEFGIVQDFLDIVYLPMRTRIADADLQTAKHTVAHAALGLGADVQKAYHQLQGSQAALEEYRQVAEAADASAEMAVKLRGAGNFSELAVTQEQARAEQAHLDVLQAQADTDEARETLTALMGLWGNDTTYTLAPGMSVLPKAEVPAKGLETLAIRQREDLGAARSEVEAQARKLGYSKTTRLFPELQLGFDAEHEVPGDWLLGPNISVPIPLFDQGEAREDKSKAQFHQAWDRYTALAVQIRSDVRVARGRLLAARTRVERYDAAILPLRHKVVEQSQLQFNGMLLSVFDLLHARQDELSSRRDYAIAQRDYWVARVELVRALGGKLPEP